MAEEENKSNKIEDFISLKQILFIFIAFLFVGLVVYSLTSNKAEIKLNFPSTTNVDPTAGLSCKSLVENSLYGMDIGQDSGIFANAQLGRDELAIELDSSGKFSLITKASIEVGETKSDEDWEVVKNDDEYLIAVLDKLGDPIPIRNSHTTFMLNKENGIATWTKSRIVGLGTSTPIEISSLLQCQ